MSPHPLLKELRRALQAVADAEKAVGMQAYMKSTMPFHGVPSPLLKKTAKTVFASVTFTDADEWRTTISALWQGARFREERYATIILGEDKRSQAHWRLATLALFEEMIVSGAWWDYVDVLASHHVGGLLRRHPKPIAAAMRKWAVDDNFWKRRTAIICQLGCKGAIDLDLLYACIEPSLGEKEFFLRKGIGWALRQHAWVDPKEVIRYVKANRDRLSPLSKREALKNLLKQGLIKEIP